MFIVSGKGLVEEMIEFNFRMWHYLLEHGNRRAADEMRRAHNRAVLYYALHPGAVYRGWGMNFEQQGIDSKAVRIAD
jgi:hypothetical protein